MSILQVLHFPDPRLRKKAPDVRNFDAALRQLAADLLETMYAEHGIGLAATQVGQPLRLIVLDVAESGDAPRIFVNPVITATSGEIKPGQEGCLSVPGYFDVVERHESIRFRWQDLDGVVHEQDADGLLAICVQHEIDHLDGRLFIDYLSPLKRQRLRKKAEKHEKLSIPAL
jgi:peptide deformylase